MDDDNIHEGLGSLNRWSHSTTSSSLSPNYVSHRRQESAPRLFATDNHLSYKKMLSLENSPQAHLLKKTDDATGKDEPFIRHHNSQSSTEKSHMDIPLSDRTELTTVSKSTAHNTGAFSLQPEPPYLESISAQHEPRTHSRSPEKGVLERTHGGFASQITTRPHSQNDKRRQGPSQKAMLSKALQKANTAVLLDNAANFEGAMEAYNDACQLLQLVMLRSNGGEDEKLKLQEIRDTYMIRVTELQRMDFPFRDVDSKALPERPLSQESYGDYIQSVPEDAYSLSNQDPRFMDKEPLGERDTASEGSRTFVQSHIPPRRQSLLPSALDDDIYNRAFSSTAQNQTDISRPVIQGAPVAHRRVHSGTNPANSDDPLPRENQHPLHSRLSELSILSAQARDPNESTSWLDTIDESGASSSPSLRSNASSVYLRRRRSTSLSQGTEAEFDAALDAAVEAAYDEGFEPASGSEAQEEEILDDDVFANARRNVEIAKQKVREAEREAEVAMTRGSELRRAQEQDSLDNVNDTGLDYFDEEAEEEERLLEEMTRGYVMDDFEFDLQSKSALPRQSALSGFSQRTWEKSVKYNPTTGGTSLSPLVEDDTLPIETNSTQQVELGLGPALAQPTSKSTPLQGVRARRMSGQNTAELKIETSARSRSGSGLVNAELAQSMDIQTTQVPILPEKDASLPNGRAETTTSASTVHQSERNVSISSVSEDMSPNLKLARETTAMEEDNTTGAPKMLSPSRPPIGKVPSAPDNLGRPHPSVLPFRSRNVSVPNPDIFTDSPATPSMNAFPTLDLQKGIAAASMNALPTPSAVNFAPSGLSSDGLYLFDNYIHSPASPGFSTALDPNAPLPLEPCPESFLLRPFWLMRCIYQTIAHPRGGYLSTKLFVPREVWRVKNVKIKAVEEKISNCDLLTAALLKLSKVDTYDADAVLEEMQAFESVLDQVQMSLSKKVGNEVGVQGAMPLFKAAPMLDDPATADAMPSKMSNGPSKSYLSSWRKLRSKNSGFGATALSSSKEASKDHLTISSLPMTPIPNAQHSNRNIAQVQFDGPHANYMSALARLCDAAQVLDQIAQQVEDPGLKHSSQTLVGLELSTRHAAEFFGFYICRFALNDIGIMLDKFIKRGSEWVLL
ncbi:uncharacterized protein ANIA_05807 [Aspergillus nidulans FGSC A4]|uniref:MIT domain-containing protein n=1 Tax=Emericella nidulans (strain FGSC A4 / ATCC 38163 / CBS 112.46 / NRRL 194 / M139) TaxID=227321 RepID=C8V097_EMENI|nr:hypothetical protein [Aspergillus nidulans FGSC A4]CBF70808.1 TPA: conserved hypothetical protein [Aspergillus nidulans FGSC A4]